MLLFPPCMQRATSTFAIDINIRFATGLSHYRQGFLSVSGTYNWCINVQVCTIQTFIYLLNIDYHFAKFRVLYCAKSDETNKMYIGYQWIPELVFVDLLWSPRIDSQAGVPVRQPYLSYRPDKLHRLAKSIPRNRFQGSINVYIYGLCILYPAFPHCTMHIPNPLPPPFKCIKFSSVVHE